MTRRCFFCKHPFLFSRVLSLDIVYCYRLSSVVCLSVCSCITSTLDKHHNTCQTVYPQFPHSVADTGWGRLAQRIRVLPRTRTRFGERGFSYCGPAAWNTYPPNLHDITDTGTFRKRLKSELYDRAYHWLLLALLDVSYSGTLQISYWLIDWLWCWCVCTRRMRSWTRRSRSGHATLTTSRRKSTASSTSRSLTTGRTTSPSRYFDTHGHSMSYDRASTNPA